MPGRLIGFIVIFVIFLLFIVSNLNNKSDINFIFKNIPDIPVFLTVFVSFIAGMLCALPFTFGFRMGKKAAEKGQKTEKAPKGKTPRRKPGKAGKGAGPEDPSLGNHNDYGID